MKLTTIIMITTLLQVSAAGMAQQLTLKKKNVSFNQVFKEIRKQTGYSVLWGSEKFDANEKVSVDFNNTPLKEALNFMVLGKGYTYLIEEKTIIIQEKVNTKSSDLPVLIKATIEVTGKVVDENGQPVGGASVLVKATGKGVSTRADGTFAMRDIEEGETLIIKYLGFENKEVKATKDLGIIRLLPAINELDQIQIQAYGKTSRRLSTSNITTIKAEEIEKQPVANPLLALQGRVPGLEIIQMSGSPGGSLKVRIQGTGSLRGGNTPFYVVDGVPYAQSMPNIGGNVIWGRPDESVLPQGIGGVSPSLMNEGFGNPMNYLNASDIESIEVLKDADATAIYGSRAANGAILITTKKGKPGKTKVDFAINSGYDKVVQRADLLNTEQYIALRREAYRNLNRAPNASNYDFNGVWSTTDQIDWQEFFYGRATTNFASNVSISGGSANTTFRVGLDYRNQGSIWTKDMNNSSYGTSISINNTTANQRLKMGLTASYSRNDNRLPIGDPIAGTSSYSPLKLAPNTPSAYNPDGSLNWAPDANGNSTVLNPFAQFLSSFRARTNNLTSSFNFAYQILDGLDVKTTVGYNSLQHEEISGDAAASRPPENRAAFIRKATFTNSSINVFQVEPQLNYHTIMGLLKMNFLLGSTYSESTTTGRSFSASGQSSDAQLNNISLATSFASGGQVDKHYRYNAGFAQVGLNYGDKYLLNLSARRDGSSRFGPENRFGNFWSVGAGWIFSEEKFIRLPKFISFAKLRASYGITGNEQVGDYSFMDLNNANLVGVPYMGIASLITQGITNKYLQWEERKKASIELYLGLLQDRVNFSTTYYRDRSGNLVQQLTVPAMVGVTSVAVNFEGVIQNSGWQFDLSSTNIKTNKFQWQTAINLSIDRNKLVSLPDLSKISGLSSFGYIVGQPLGTRYDHKYLGVDPLTGYYIRQDLNGNPTSSAPNIDDRTLVRPSKPLSGGLNNTFIYKGFSVSAHFQFAKVQRPRFATSNNFGATDENQPTSILGQYWQYPGDVKPLMRAGTGGNFNNYTGSDAYFVDADYLRLKNLSANYSLPEKWIKKLGMRSCSLSYNVQNLLTITGYSGLDPESGSDTEPPHLTMQFGIRAGF